MVDSLGGFIVHIKNCFPSLLRPTDFHSVVHRKIISAAWEITEKNLQTTYYVHYVLKLMGFSGCFAFPCVSPLSLLGTVVHGRKHCDLCCCFPGEWMETIAFFFAIVTIESSILKSFMKWNWRSLQSVSLEIFSIVMIQILDIWYKQQRLQFARYASSIGGQNSYQFFFQIN